MQPYDGTHPFPLNCMDKLPKLTENISEIPEESTVLITFTIGHYTWNAADPDKPSSSANSLNSPSRMSQSGYKWAVSLNLHDVVVLHLADNRDHDSSSIANSDGEIF